MDNHNNYYLFNLAKEDIFMPMSLKSGEKSSRWKKFNITKR